MVPLFKSQNVIAVKEDPFLKELLTFSIRTSSTDYITEFQVLFTIPRIEQLDRLINHGVLTQKRTALRSEILTYKDFYNYRKIDIVGISIDGALNSLEYAMFFEYYGISIYLTDPQREGSKLIYDFRNPAMADTKKELEEMLHQVLSRQLEDKSYDYEPGFINITSVR